MNDTSNSGKHVDSPCGKCRRLTCPGFVSVLGLALVLAIGVDGARAQHSVARLWDEQLLHAISQDTARLSSSRCSGES